MTEDGFRKRFQLSKPEGSDIFLQFSSRLDSYVERWVELSRTDKSYEGFLCEQFLLCCTKELSLLKERIPPTMQDMTRYSYQYVEARTSSSLVTEDSII